MKTIEERIRLAAMRTHTSPTDAQREAGNYRMGMFPWKGMEIRIENPKGSIRSGVNRLGVPWSVRMAAHYGYLRRTMSDADGDAIDVFVGPHPESDLVCVVDQRNPAGQWDEHKCIIGASNVAEAKQLYLNCYSPGWTGFKSITPMTVMQFREWLKHGSTKRPIASQVSKYSRNEIEPMDERVQRAALAYSRGGHSMSYAMEWIEETQAQRHPRDASGKWAKVKVKTTKLGSRWYSMADLPSGEQVTRSHEDESESRRLAHEDVREQGFEPDEEEQKPVMQALDEAVQETFKDAGVKRKEPEKPFPNHLATQAEINAEGGTFPEKSVPVVPAEPPEPISLSRVTTKFPELTDDEHELIEEAIGVPLREAADGDDLAGAISHLQESELYFSKRNKTSKVESIKKAMDYLQSRFDSEESLDGVPTEELEGPKEGDHSADGLVFHDGRWHREDGPEAEHLSALEDAEELEPQESEAEALEMPAELAETTETEPEPDETAPNPHVALSQELAEKLNSGEKITAKALFEAADRAHGGTRAEGTYGQSDAYDSLESAVNQHIEDLNMDPSADYETAVKQAEQLGDIVNQLPTQTNRSGNKESFQQFSTPPNYAFAAAWAAGIKPGDKVLEPSAGTGSLAVHAKNAGAEVHVNELDPRRAEFLKHQFGAENTTIENAEQIAGILPDRGYDAVVMNPPFSQTAGRMGDKKELMTAADHISEASLMLKPEGRLVSIVGRGMSPDSPRYKEWFRKMADEGMQLRANVLVSGDVYKKYGTHFDSRVLVFDKSEEPIGEPVTGEVGSVPELMAKLKDIHDDRPERSGAEPPLDEVGEIEDQEPSRGLVAVDGTPVEQPGLSDGTGPADSGGGTDELRAGLAGDATAVGPGIGGTGDEGKPKRSRRSPVGSSGRTAKPAKSGEADWESAAGQSDGQSGKPAIQLRPASPLNITPINPDENKTTGELGASLYESYHPQRFRIEGATPHPTPLVESAAMASVQPPEATYRPHLSPDIAEKGILSEAQLESVVYAGQAHQQMLPGSETEPERRRGYFIGDGCVAAGTRIFDPETGTHTAIEVLMERGVDHTVLSLTSDGLVPTKASCPFVKGESRLYRVCLESGREIVVTSHHRFLTPNGWSSIDAGLRAGHSVASADGRTLCNLGFVPSIRAAGDRHWMRKAEDCLGDCFSCFDPCGGLLHATQGTSREVAPSRDDARRRIRTLLHTDGLGLSREHSRSSRCDHLSKSGSLPSSNHARAATSDQAIACVVQSLSEDDSSVLQLRKSSILGKREVSERHNQQVRRDACCSRTSIASERPNSSDIELHGEDSCQVETQSTGRFPSPNRLLRSSPKESNREVLSVAYASVSPVSNVSDSEKYHSRWDRVSSASYERTDVFYDMIVPGTQNYVAEGIVNHNTGAAKGRQIAGIIEDNWNQGRKKAVWISKSKTTLFKTSQRDWSALGHPEDEVMQFSKMRDSADMPTEGVAYLTYDTLKSKPRTSGKQSNIDALVNWLGKDFDGVIALDESHLCGNALQRKGARGKVEPSQRALTVLELQKRLPKARVVYSSATGATEVSNLAYADRLGIWGPGTAFPSQEDFIASMDAGGVAAMEAVAQSLKATGNYASRSLTFDDGTPTGQVTYERLTHHLADHQKETYDDLAEAWQNVLQNVDKALEITGGKNDGQASSAARSQFWGGHQRFFNQIITAMQTPAVIAAMEKDRAEGRAPVVQLVNTMEAATTRGIKNRTEDQDIEDIDVSPREVLARYLDKSFPTERYKAYVDENGNTRARPVMKQVRDDEGKVVNGVDGKPLMEHVQDPKAVAMKENLLSKVGALRIPESPLDQIVNHFGHERVAEATGRSVRIVKKDTDKGRVKVIESRNPDIANVAESKAFQNGQKDFMVFSDAGGTGVSYHASAKAKNQKQRVHYMLQPGWRADAAVQGIGRTHRTNQVVAPTYRLVEIGEIPGQKRFISTIARRLDQLGALTRGQRQAGSSGMFSAMDNLESKQAKQAVSHFFKDLEAGKIPGLDHQQVMQHMGLAKEKDETKKAEGRGKKDNSEDVTVGQFLNRLLSLKLGMQNQVFSAFEGHLQQEVERAIQDGTLDNGVENFRAHEINKTTDNVIYREPSSGATVRHIVAKVKNPSDRRSFESVIDAPRKPEKFVQNGRSGQVWAVYSSLDQTDPVSGKIEPQVMLRGPGGSQYRPRSEVEWTWGSRSTPFNDIDQAEAKRKWDEHYAKLPEFTEGDAHFITGALLPVWNRIPGGDSPRVRRVRFADGETIVGREIPEAHVSTVMKNFQQSPDSKTYDANTVHVGVGGGTHIATLSNGWKLKPVRRQGEERIQITGPTSSADFRALEQAGAMKERINYSTEWFVPTGDNGKAVIQRLTQANPVVEMNKKERYSKPVEKRVARKRVEPPFTLPAMNPLPEMTADERITLAKGSYRRKV